MARKHNLMLKKIKREFEKKKYFLFPTSEKLYSGVPDLVGLSPEGRFVGIEIKTEEGKNPEKLLRPTQKYFKDKIIKNKGEFFIFYGKGLITRILE